MKKFLVIAILTQSLPVIAQLGPALSVVSNVSNAAVQGVGRFIPSFTSQVNFQPSMRVQAVVTSDVLRKSARNGLCRQRSVQLHMPFGQQRRCHSTSHSDNNSGHSNDDTHSYCSYGAAGAAGFVSGCVAYSWMAGKKDDAGDISKFSRKIEREDIVWTMFEQRNNPQALKMMKDLVRRLDIRPWEIRNRMMQFVGRADDVTDNNIKELIDLVSEGNLVDRALCCKQDDFAKWYIARDHNKQGFNTILLALDRHKHQLFKDTFYRAFGFDRDKAFTQNKPSEIVQMIKKHGVDHRLFISKAIADNQIPFIAEIFNVSKSGISVDMNSAFLKAIEVNNVQVARMILSNQLVDKHGNPLWQSIGRLDWLVEHATDLNRIDIVRVLTEKYKELGSRCSDGTGFSRYTRALFGVVKNNNWEMAQLMLSQEGLEEYKMREVLAYAPKSTDKRILNAIQKYIDTGGPVDFE